MNKRIRELRKRKGLNQTEFGAKIGLSQRAYFEDQNTTFQYSF